MKDKYTKVLLVLPALVLLIGLAVYPLIFAVRSSFFEWNYGEAVRFIGLENYLTVFTDDFVLNSLKNTGIYVAVAVFFEFVIGLALAIFTNQRLGRFRPGIRTALTIPMLVSPIVVGILWRMIYNPHYGLFNWVMGTPDFAPTGNTTFSIYFVAFADIWQWTPFMYIIFLAALQSVPKEITEAASVDGANYWQNLIHITLPSISYAMVIAATLRFMDATKALDLIYTLTMGGPGISTETIGYHIFRKAFNDFNIGFATAYAVVFAIFLGLVITNFLKWLNRRFKIV